MSAVCRETAMNFIRHNVKYFTRAGMVSQMMPGQVPIIIFTVCYPVTSLHVWIGVVIKLRAGQLGNLGSIRDMTKKPFSKPFTPTQGPPTLLFGFIWRSVSGDEEAGLWNWPLTPSSAKIQNDWGPISTPHTPSWIMQVPEYPYSILPLRWLLSSGMWCHIIWWTYTDVWEETAASIVTCVINVFPARAELIQQSL